MSISPRPLILAGLLAASSAPLLLTLALHSQPVPKTKPAAPDAAALNVARLLDGLAQSRFQDTNMMVFGMSRISPQPAPRQHAIFQLAPINPHETADLKAADASHRDYLVSLLHCAPVPPLFPERFQAQFQQVPLGYHPPRRQSGPPDLASLFRSPTPPYRPYSPPLTPNGPYLTPLVVHGSGGPSQAFVRDSLSATAVAALPTLRKGQEAGANHGGWTVLMSPVRAAQSSCLSCHTTAKRGDTLGVMVYAVSDTVNKP